MIGRSSKFLGATLILACIVTAAAAWVLIDGSPAYVTPPGASGRERYVAPNGLPYNDGSRTAPWDLVTALSKPELSRPGDVIWIRGGVYRGPITSQLIGEPGAPIVVRVYPGERAILDASVQHEPTLVVKGSDTWYWGLEVTDSYPDRISAQPSYPEGFRPTSISVLGPRTRFINMVVHDGEQGFGFWAAANDAELYGNLIYNVGIDAGDRGHGHSIYVQNESGGKRLIDNILFNGHSFGVHAYTEQGYLDHIRLEGNTSFNHGVLSRSGPKANYLFRTKNDAPPKAPTLIENYGYYPDGPSGIVADLTTPVPFAKGCLDAVVNQNYFVGPVALALSCQSIRSIDANTFMGKVFGFEHARYPRNRYESRPARGVAVFVRPNQYERGRGQATIFNWDKRPAVAINVSRLGLKSGDAYEVRDAQNYFGPPVASGRFRPSIDVVVPMEGLTVAAPIGHVSVPPRHTGPEFGVFIIQTVATPDRSH